MPEGPQGYHPPSNQCFLDIFIIEVFQLLIYLIIVKIKGFLPQANVNVVDFRRYLI
jgi:hypothetical protein